LEISKLELNNLKVVIMILLSDSQVPNFLLPLQKKMVKFRESLDPIELNNYWIVMEYIQSKEIEKEEG
jgi:hypothetical protein